jgi:hypothetical protein
MLFPIYDGSLEDVAFNERPTELRAFDWNVVGAEEKAWRQGLNANDWRHCPASIGRLHLIGERSWFVRPQWEWPREERCRGIWADPAGEAVTCDALASRVELTHEMHLRGIELDQKQILVWNDERQLEGAQHRWIAINSDIARDLGWIPSPGRPFEWLDRSGDVMVKSEFWRDGWRWLEPPRFESLGEGVVVLASDKALDALADRFPLAESHLWVERHRGGEDPYESAWHLVQPISRSTSHGTVNA